MVVASQEYNIEEAKPEEAQYVICHRKFFCQYFFFRLARFDFVFQWMEEELGSIAPSGSQKEFVEKRLENKRINSAEKFRQTLGAVCRQQSDLIGQNFNAPIAKYEQFHHWKRVCHSVQLLRRTYESK